MQIVREGSIQWLNFHHLYLFFVIGQEGSLALASQRLGIRQPALSTQLRQFEEALGVELFHRENRRLKLTEHGRLAMEYAHQIFHLGAEMVDAVHDRSPIRTLRVQIGALDSIAKSIVLKLCQDAEAAQDCEVTLVEGKADELLRELVNHQIDLFISDHASPPPERGQRLFNRKVADLPVVVVGHPRFARLRSGFPRSISSQRLLLPTDASRLRGAIEHCFSRSDVKPGRLHETQDMSLLILMAEAGQGLAAVPRAAIDRQIKEKSLVVIGELAGVYDEIYLVSASRRLENPVSSRLFRQFSLA